MSQNAVCSNAAENTKAIFSKTFPRFYKAFIILLDPLLTFLVESFSFSMDASQLPETLSEETPGQTRIRNKLVWLLIREFRQHHLKPEVDRDYDHDIFTFVLYWWLKDRWICDDQELWAQQKTRIDLYQLEDYTPKSVPKLYCPFVFVYNAARSSGDVVDGARLRSRHFSETGPKDWDKHRPVFDNEDRQQWMIDVQLSLSLKQNTAVSDNSPSPISTAKADTDSFHNDQGQEEALQVSITETATDSLQHSQGQAEVLQYCKLGSNDLSLARPERKPLELARAVPPLGIVDHVPILRNVISKTKSDFEDRYRIFQQNTTENVASQLCRALEKKVEVVLKEGISSAEDLRSIDVDPTHDPAPGVYLHLLVEDSSLGKFGADCFWVYVGQAISMQQRIKDHKSLVHRSNHSSLHYHVWHQIKEPISVWIKLMGFKDGTEYLPELLNLGEMWMACALQSLQELDLQHWLPEGTTIPWAGLHLNISLPIWQPFVLGKCYFQSLNTREDFSRALQSHDPTERARAISIRDSYHSLRHSPWPEIREYYEKARECGSREFDSSTSDQETIQRAQKFLELGSWLQYKPPKHQVNWGDFPIIVAKTKLNLPLEDCESIFVKPMLVDRPHFLRYARAALPSDPASRLLFLAKVTKDGHDYYDWLETDGKTIPQRMNVLVDRFEGRKYAEIRGVARRKLKRKCGKERSVFYTRQEKEKTT